MKNFSITCDECGSDADLVMSGLELHAIKCTCCGHQFAVPGAERRGHVYFATTDDGGPVKIGFTEGYVIERVRSLQTGSPQRLHLAGAVPADPTTERAFHKIFAHSRLHGEWFERTDSLVTTIKAIRAVTHECPILLDKDKL